MHNAALQKTCIALLISQLVSPEALAATISVDGANCTLSEAIETANSGVLRQGCSQGDASGPDVIELNADIVLSGSVSSFNGLAFIQSDITLNGNNHSISRSDTATDEFRIMPILAGNVVLNDVTISQGRLPNPFRGAGIYVDDDVSLTLNRSTITGNSAGKDGGGIYSKGTLALYNSTIEQNTADQLGGGLYVSDGSLTINNSLIDSNTGLWGGGMFVSFPTVVDIQDSDVTHNESTGTQVVNGTQGGGGLYFHRLYKANIDGGTIAYNKTAEYGRGAGVLLYRGLTVSLKNAEIHNNTGHIGGGIHLERGTRVEILDNMIHSNSAVGGAGISSRQTTELKITRNQILNNTAQLSAGFSDVGSQSLVISDSTISGNTAVSDSAGGGIGLSGSSSLTVLNSTINNNTAGSGAGVNARSTFRDVRFINTTVSGNRATFSHGGGISLVGNPLGPGANANIFVLLNSTVSNNTAAESGGGVNTFNVSNLMFANSIISGNTAAVSGKEMNYYHQNGGFNILDNNVWGDASSTFAEAFNSVSRVFTPSSSDILATSDAGASGATARSIPIRSIILPLADNGGLTRTHRLANRSPAIDAGGDQFFPVLNVICPSVDQRSKSRDRPCDIGAYETEGQSCFVVKDRNGKILTFCL